MDMFGALERSPPINLLNMPPIRRKEPNDNRLESLPPISYWTCPWSGGKILSSPISCGGTSHSRPSIGFSLSKPFSSRKRRLWGCLVYQMPRVPIGFSHTTISMQLGQVRIFSPWSKSEFNQMFICRSFIIKESRNYRHDCQKNEDWNSMFSILCQWSKDRLIGYTSINRHIPCKARQKKGSP